MNFDGSISCPRSLITVYSVKSFGVIIPGKKRQWVQANELFSLYVKWTHLSINQSALSTLCFLWRSQ